MRRIGNSTSDFPDKDVLSLSGTIFCNTRANELFLFYFTKIFKQVKKILNLFAMLLLAVFANASSPPLTDAAATTPDNFGFTEMVPINSFTGNMPADLPNEAWTTHIVITNGESTLMFTLTSDEMNIAPFTASSTGNAPSDAAMQPNITDVSTTANYSSDAPFPDNIVPLLYQNCFCSDAKVEEAPGANARSQITSDNTTKNVFQSEHGNIGGFITMQQTSVNWQNDGNIKQASAFQNDKVNIGDAPQAVTWDQGQAMNQANSMNAAVNSSGSTEKDQGASPNLNQSSTVSSGANAIVNFQPRE